VQNAGQQQKVGKLMMQAIFSSEEVDE